MEFVAPLDRAKTHATRAANGSVDREPNTSIAIAFALIALVEHVQDLVGEVARVQHQLDVIANEIATRPR